MPDADLQSHPELVLAPSPPLVSGLVTTSAEPDSQGTCNSWDAGSDTEEEDNTALEAHYLNNKTEEYQRRVETVLGDGLRIWKSMGGTWYTYIEGEVVEGHAVLPAKYRQHSHKETPPADRHSLGAAHTTVEQSAAVQQSTNLDQTISFDQSISLEHADVFKQPTTSDENIFTRLTTANHSTHGKVYKQPTTGRHPKAHLSPTKPSGPRTFITGITKPAQPPSRTPAPALTAALAHRTRDVTHLSTIFHHGSAVINPLGAHARSVPNKIVPPSVAPLTLQEQPTAAQRPSLAQRRGVDVPSELIFGMERALQQSQEYDSEEYPPTARGYSSSPRSAVAHLAHRGGSPAGTLSTNTSHTSSSASVASASPRRVFSGSFGTFEGSPGRFDERKYRLFPAGKAATNSSVDGADVPVASFESAGSGAGSPAKKNRLAWLRGHED